MANEENRKIGTVVLFIDENISPSKWSIARVKPIHPRNDGTTRVITFKRPKRADQKRAIHTLIPFPVNENIENNIWRQMKQIECAYGY